MLVFPEGDYKKADDKLAELLDCMVKRVALASAFFTCFMAIAGLLLYIIVSIVFPALAD